MKVTQNPSLNTGLIDSTKAADKAKAKGDVHSTAGSTGAREAGSVEISDNAHLMQKAADIARSAPDVRTDKIAALKKAISEGTYQVAADKLAEKILDEHLATDFGKNNV